jgi:type VI secretion system protein ImpK
MQQVDEIIAPCLDAVRQIQHADPQRLPDAEHVHKQLSAIIDQIGPRAAAIGFSDRAIDDVRYALVALADEIALLKGGGLREYWVQRPLQMHYYNENIAGERFFDRLEEIQRDPQRRQTLRVYYLCLLLGFQGQYRVRGGELTLADIVDGVKNDLMGHTGSREEEPLSPHGARPYEAVTDIRRNLLLLWIAVAGVMASLLLFIVLRLRVSQQASDLVERITALVSGF